VPVQIGAGMFGGAIINSDWQYLFRRYGALGALSLLVLVVRCDDSNVVTVRFTSVCDKYVTVLQCPFLHSLGRPSGKRSLRVLCAAMPRRARIQNRYRK